MSTSQGNYFLFALVGVQPEKILLHQTVICRFYCLIPDVLQFIFFLLFQLFLVLL